MFPHAAFYRIPRLDRWAATFLREDGSADTYELLVGMTRTIERTFKHVARHEKGVQEPARTLQCGSGSCRDLCGAHDLGASLAGNRRAVCVWISASW